MTREEILSAAVQIIGQKGFHATSMQDIAEAVNLQKASLYYHVSSKQEILVDILDQALDLFIANMQAVMASPLPPDDKLRQAMQTYMVAILSKRDLASVLLLEHRSLEPELHARHIPRRDRFEGLWRDLIHQGVEAGCYFAVDPAMTARALLGVMNWVITWYSPHGNFTPEQISSQYADLFLKGLMRH
jgi:TetR/AcrR family transcriptional regulator, cholesterol catabolism regulator